MSSAADSSEVPATSATCREIKIGKTVVPRKARGKLVAQVFTMTIGAETILLLPLKNWTQLDTFKWKARGILPRTPAGLEITLNWVKVGSETVSTFDPQGCEKLQKAFNDWLAVERQALELAQAKIQPPVAQPQASQPEEDAFRFQVELDNTGRGRVRCLEGNDTVKLVGLNLQGLNALIDQDFMRKPRSLKVGALHDWVELDGDRFRFQKDTDWAAKLETVLNERYVWSPEPGSPPDVAIFSNPASPTGFDIQFPATPNGLVENRRQHLNEESLQLLQDPQRCRVLRKGTIAKFTPPNLVFKRKTADGGERYLLPGPNNTVSAMSENGQVKLIDLSQPVSLLNLSAGELAAVLNHPTLNRRAKLAELAASRAAER